MSPFARGYHGPRLLFDRLFCGHQYSYVAIIAMKPRSKCHVIHWEHVSLTSAPMSLFSNPIHVNQTVFDVTDERPLDPLDE